MHLSSVTVTKKKRRHRLLWVGRKGNFWQPQNQNGKRNKYLSCLARNETVGRKPYKIKTKPNHLRDQYTNIFKALREREIEGAMRDYRVGVSTHCAGLDIKT